MHRIIYNPVIVFIIGFVTFGIGNLIFIFLFSEHVAREYHLTIIPMREVVINLLTFGIYGIIWTYKTIMLIEAEDSRVTSSALLAAIISAIPFLRCISMAVISSKLINQS